MKTTPKRKYKRIVLRKISFEDSGATCVISDNQGIYAYQSFAQAYFTDVQKAEYPDLLAGPDSEFYCEDWESYEWSDPTITVNGKDYKVHSSEGGIWLIPAEKYDLIDWDSLA